MVDTKLLRSVFPGMPGITPKEEARTPVYHALSPEAAGISGQYFEHMRAGPMDAPDPWPGHTGEVVEDG